MADLLDLAGLVGLVLGLLALVRGQLGWARLGSRRAAVVELVAALVVLGVGADLTPQPATSTAGAAAPTESPATQPLTPTVASAPTTSPGGQPSSADPEANPTNTAPVNTSGWTVAPVPTGARSGCRTGDPLANVYHPYRLQVVAPCTTVSGTVETVRHEDDGDYHIDLALDPAYTGMLDAANTTYQHGWLVVEIVPADEPGCTVGRPPRPASGTYNYGICTGADETPPPVGAHVWVTGPYVIDHWHDWTEIHPAWAFSSTRPGGAPPAPVPPASATTPAPVASSAGVTLSCSARMSNPSPTDYSTTTVIVSTAPDASVSTTAHYKSTDTTHAGTADGSGTARIPYDISRATIGYRVVVDVTATLAGRSATCSTSFTPVS